MSKTEEIERAIQHVLRVHRSRVPPRGLPPDEAVRNYRALLTNGTVQAGELLAIRDLDDLDAFEGRLAERLQRFS